ncbi:uncharacterized protein FMAN_15462 [Fusarium mangiferae]|uniref:Uncharacterized protein n=1 Tax=Fusarium mangiferae TaxID=192010 RepID=A0A1L7UMA3_FUSMA|nr:uncharacterized protein FMAN_15462 [Fusarium mangiferae]CVL09225.1 uncharacterized protein FMAN_15462 [Fusarium mangiferae]
MASLVISDKISRAISIILSVQILTEIPTTRTCSFQLPGPAERTHFLWDAIKRMSLYSSCCTKRRLVTTSVPALIERAFFSQLKVPKTRHSHHNCHSHTDSTTTEEAQAALATGQRVDNSIKDIGNDSIRGISSICAVAQQAALDAHRAEPQDPDRHTMFTLEMFENVAIVLHSRATRLFFNRALDSRYDYDF